jgi:hypothetical protein
VNESGMVKEDSMLPCAAGFHEKGDWCNKSNDVSGLAMSGRVWSAGAGAAACVGKGGSADCCSVAVIAAKPRGRLEKGGVTGAPETEDELRGGSKCFNPVGVVPPTKGCKSMGGGVLAKLWL